MCDGSNAKEIIEELLKQIEQADYQFKEELVLKVAILAERYAPDLRWYIDVILKVTQRQVICVFVSSHLRGGGSGGGGLM